MPVTITPVVPPGVEHELTAVGGTLHATVRSLVPWTDAHQEGIAAAEAVCAGPLSVVTAISDGMTPVHWKVVIDAADPHAQADFWAAALRYETEDNDALIQRLLGLGALPREAVVEYHARLAFRDLVAVRHPDDPYDKDSGTGLGRRLLFQRVPEPKTVKNRLHLDLHPGEGSRSAEVERLTGLGARVLREVSEPSGAWVVMADPEGNEFCVH